MASSDFIPRSVALFILESFLTDGYKPKYSAMFRDELLDKIKNIPAINAEPVRYAGWVPQPCGAKKPQWWECSNCSTMGSPHWKRCPICESKMLEHVGTEVK